MHFLDFIFPKRCVGCGKVGGYFCQACKGKIRVVESNEAICPVCEKLAIGGATHPRCQAKYAPDGLTSFFRYDGAVRKAVKSIKYRYVSDLAREFISLIPLSSSNLPSIIYDQRSILVPIPLHPSRYRHRGFNQAEVLGKLLAARLDIPMRADMIRRVKETLPQVEMKDRKKRLVNMEGVFGLNISSNSGISGVGTVSLFDDVFTTGATMRSAAHVLKRAGAKFVWAVTMAR